MKLPIWDEPNFPLYSTTRRHRIIKKNSKYHIQKKGWLFWKAVEIVEYEVWFWPVYTDAIYTDWKQAVDRMRWEEL